MISQDEARARVARGAAHLDTIKPGWHARIDTGTLTLWDPCGCIVGQLCGSGDHFCDGYIALGLTGGAFGTTIQYGFDLNYKDTNFGADKDEVFAMLQDDWIDAIAARLHPVREAIPTETPVTV